MARYPLKFRMSSYNEAEFYQLAVVGRRAVAPGERISRLVADIRFQSATYGMAVLTPCLVQTWAFYVPWRLVWDEWIDFIALSDTVTTVPVTSDPAPKFLEGGAAGNRSALPRRAYKLIYNQYFGDESDIFAWYSNVDDDTVVEPGRLLIWDQWRSHLRQGAYTPSSMNIPVVGTDAVLVLDDLQRSLRANTSRRKQRMTGDKYVDTMRLMGVELDWRVQMAPEFLGSSQQVIMGQTTDSTFPDGDTGSTFAQQVTRYAGQQQLMLKRRLAFAEHGIIFVLAGFRPLIGQEASCLDASMIGQSTYFRPDVVGGPMDEFGASDYERLGRYLKGRNVIGSWQNSQAFIDPSGEALYPDGSTVFPVAPGSVPVAVSLMSDVSFSGLTPVPSGRA